MTFDRVYAFIAVVLEDSTTPRTVRDTLSRMQHYLKTSTDDAQRKIATALSDLEELSSDVNIPPYVRTQLYSISSQLEAIGNQ